MTATISSDQQDMVDTLVHTANNWLGPMPAGCERMEPLPARLAGMIFSLFPELDGSGNLPPCRLSPKTAPDVDLVDHDLHSQWPSTHADDPHVREFLTAVAGVLAAEQATGGDPREAMGRLLTGLCRLIETGYALALLDVDDDGNVTGEGPDVAPGLTEAVWMSWQALGERG